MSNYTTRIRSSDPVGFGFFLFSICVFVMLLNTAPCLLLVIQFISVLLGVLYFIFLAVEYGYLGPNSMFKKIRAVLSVLAVLRLSLILKGH